MRQVSSVTVVLYATNCLKLGQDLDIRAKDSSVNGEVVLESPMILIEIIPGFNKVANPASCTSPADLRVIDFSFRHALEMRFEIVYSILLQFANMHHLSPENYRYTSFPDC
jgi:hypothetical protein